MTPRENRSSIGKLETIGLRAARVYYDPPEPNPTMSSYVAVVSIGANEVRLLTPTAAFAKLSHSDIRAVASILAGNEVTLDPQPYDTYHDASDPGCIREVDVYAAQNT